MVETSPVRAVPSLPPQGLEGPGPARTLPCLPGPPRVSGLFGRSLSRFCCTLSRNSEGPAPLKRCLPSHPESWKDQGQPVQVVPPWSPKGPTKPLFWRGLFLRPVASSARILKLILGMKVCESRSRCTLDLGSKIAQGVSPSLGSKKMFSCVPVHPRPGP